MTDQDDLSIEESYVDLRNTLIRYLRGLGSSNSEELADEAISRILKSRNEMAPIDNLEAYGLGVARNVYLESVRKPALYRIGVTESGVFTDEAETLDRCLTSCLKTLTKEQRRIIEIYYLGSGQSLIESRRRLAERLGITLNALRIDVYRIRKRLRQCVEECADRKTEK